MFRAQLKSKATPRGGRCGFHQSRVLQSLAWSCFPDLNDLKHLRKGALHLETGSRQRSWASSPPRAGGEAGETPKGGRGGRRDLGGEERWLLELQEEGLSRGWARLLLKDFADRLDRRLLTSLLSQGS